MNNQIAQDLLKELLHYNPETGIFTNKTNRSSRARKGEVAGVIDKTTGYVKIGLSGKRYHAHRLAVLYMTGEFPEDQTDHEDHNRANNKWLNISPISHANNTKNRTMRSDNKSGVTGIYWNKLLNKWRAVIGVDGKTISLGCHTDIDKAVAAREEAKVKYGYHSNHGLIA